MSNAGRRAAFQKCRFAQTDSKYPQQCDDLLMYQPEVEQPSRRRPGKWSKLIVIIIFVGFPLYYLGYGAYDLFRYQTGTPTTATDIHCHVPRHSASRHSGLSGLLRPKACTGTWSVNGQSHTGAIEGPKGGFDTFAVADVRVNGDTAYTADAAMWRFVVGTGAAAIFALFLLWVRWIGRTRRRYRESTLPPQT